MKDNYKDKELYYRLIALWVVCEAFAGGIMHGIKLPFTGMIVSSLAVTCIILIGWHIPERGAILKATIIVAIFKLMLSPHSPPTAYIAVFFQGYMGEILFNGRKHFKISAIALAILALVESAIQRILVLIIVYGNQFWKAIDLYLQKLSPGNDIHYSQIFAITYIIIHAIAGFIIGVYAVRLVKHSESLQHDYSDIIISHQDLQVSLPDKKKRKIKSKIIFVVLWAVLACLFVHAYFQPSNSVLPANEIVRIFLRSILIILTWLLILSPLLMSLIRRSLNKQKHKYNTAIAIVMELLPGMRHLFITSWRMSVAQKGIYRLKLFIKILLLNILLPR